MLINSQCIVWIIYVCLGIVVFDEMIDCLIILMVVYCVYEDEYKGFVCNVMFILNQDQIIGLGMDYDCDNDLIGCWVLSFGVVLEEWFRVIFLFNLYVDYGYYVVNDVGVYFGVFDVYGVLDQVVILFDVLFEIIIINLDELFY